MPRLNVSSTSTLIRRAGSGGMKLILRNPTGNGIIDLRIGVAPVSGADFELAGGESIAIELEPGDRLYGIATAAQTENVHILELR